LLIDAALGEVRKQRLADPTTPKFRADEEIFQIYAVTPAEGGEVVEPERESGDPRFASLAPFGDVAEHPRCGTEQGLLERGPRGVDLIEQFFVIGQLADQFEQGGGVVVASGSQLQHGVSGVYAAAPVARHIMMPQRLTMP